MVARTIARGVVKGAKSVKKAKNAGISGQRAGEAAKDALGRGSVVRGVSSGQTPQVLRTTPDIGKRLSTAQHRFLRSHAGRLDEIKRLEAKKKKSTIEINKLKEMKARVKKDTTKVAALKKQRKDAFTIAAEEGSLRMIDPKDYKPSVRKGGAIKAKRKSIKRRT